MQHECILIFNLQFCCPLRRWRHCDNEEMELVTTFSEYFDIGTTCSGIILHCSHSWWLKYNLNTLNSQYSSLYSDCVYELLKSYFVYQDRELINDMSEIFEQYTTKTFWVSSLRRRGEEIGFSKLIQLSSHKWVVEGDKPGVEGEERKWYSYSTSSQDKQETF